MGKKTQTVAAPDPTTTANAQSTANIATADATQKMNLLGTSGPDGTTGYKVDPSQPGGYTQYTNLSPGQQNVYDQGVQAQGSALGVANDQIGRVGTALGQTLTNPTLQGQIGGDYNQTVKTAQDAAYNQATSRLDPQYAQLGEELNTRLSNQGLSQNSTAYQNAQGNFARDKNDAYQTAQNNAVTQGLAAQNQGFNQSAAQGTFANQTAQQGLTNQAYVQNEPLNQFNSLMSSNQVSAPTAIGYSPTQVGNTDVLGAYALNQQAQQANANAKNAANQGITSGLFSLGSAALMSDRRLKRDVTFLGMDGAYRVYSFRYLWSKVKHIGVMAQEVRKIRPKAVKRHWSGFLMVRYGAL